MNTVTQKIDDRLEHALSKRKSDGSLRKLIITEGLVDFCSNDYLGFARSADIKNRASEIFLSWGEPAGSTGSRSISGNSIYAEALENQIAKFHGCEAALLFNSGYNANVGLFSSLPQRGDTIITDELIHASIIDGCRLSHANRMRFAHNDVDDLRAKLQKASGNIFVAVESVYSMDGDTSPLHEVAALCSEFGAALIVDEAHATGVFGDCGRGLVNELGLEEHVFAKVHTFGKALGGHGAVVTGSTLLKNYLLNFSRPFIFTTALPAHALAWISAAYETLQYPDFSHQPLRSLVNVFKHTYQGTNSVKLIESRSPVQCVIVGGNERTRSVANDLQQHGFDVRAILAPSVAVGQERLRIILHAHNTENEVRSLTSHLHKALEKWAPSL